MWVDMTQQQRALPILIICNYSTTLLKIGSRIHPRTLRNSDTTEHVILSAASVVRRLCTQRHAPEPVGQRIVLILYTSRLVLEQGCQLATATGQHRISAAEQQLELWGTVQTSPPGEFWWVHWWWCMLGYIALCIALDHVNDADVCRIPQTTVSRHFCFKILLWRHTPELTLIVKSRNKSRLPAIHSSLPKYQRCHLIWSYACIQISLDDRP